MRRLLRSAPRALLLAALSLPAAADVLVVDPSGAGDFTTVADAVAAALDQDVVLVKSGTYDGGFEIVDKSLIVVADAGATVVVSGLKRVRDLAAHRRVVLTGFEMRGTFDPTLIDAGHGLMLVANEGAVRVENCTATGASQPSPFSLPPCGVHGGAGWPGVSIEGCADVSLVACTAIGGDSSYAAQGFCWVSADGADGLKASVSRVAIFHSHLRGGVGSAANNGRDGGAGLRVVGGSAFVSGGTVLGGAGGAGVFHVSPTIRACGGNGGPGIVFDGVAPGDSVVVGIELLEGGPVGLALPIPAVTCFSTDGPATVGGPTVSLPGPARHMQFTTPVQGGDSFEITFHGAPNDLALVGVGAAEVHVPVLPFHGVLLLADLGTPWLTWLDANGHGVLTLSTPPIPGAVFTRTLALQCGFVTSDLEIRLGPSRYQVVLPAGS